MPHKVYKFVHLQMFNVKYKCVHLQLFYGKFLFSEKHIFCEQKRTAVYGSESLVSDFKLPRENDHLLSLKHINFEVMHPVQKSTQNKRNYEERNFSVSG